MTSIHSVHCKCGFSNSVRVGGTRESFLKECFFPHYCKKCGIVDVNIANKKIFCPICKSTKVIAYGEKSISNYTEQEIIPAVQSFKYRAFKDGNFCPKCEELTLALMHADMIFD